MYEVRNDANTIVSKHVGFNAAKFQATVLANRAKDYGDNGAVYTVVKIEEVWTTSLLSGVLRDGE